MLQLLIMCDEKWHAAQELALEHRDNSLNACINRLMGWMNRHSETVAIRISSGFVEHCFLFSEERADGSTGICGGIAFHGFPEDGYRQNGSVQIEPQYGWQIHT